MVGGGHTTVRRRGGGHTTQRGKQVRRGRSTRIERVAELVVVLAVRVVHGAAAAARVGVLARRVSPGRGRAAEAVTADAAGAGRLVELPLRHVGEDGRDAAPRVGVVLGAGAATCHRETQAGLAVERERARARELPAIMRARQ